MAPADSGISRDSVPTGATLIAIIVFVSLSLYNVVELSFIILATFKRRGGLYFWSFVVATWGIVPYAVGFLIKALQVPVASWVYATMIVVGWCCMVTGQSVVLYSRLHIVLRNQSRLRLVLAMIVVNAIICHVPIIVMVYGANSSNPGPFIGPYSVYERVQVTLFFLQEIVISAIYINETLALMRTRRRCGIGGDMRRLMIHLVIVNIIVVLLDVTILGLEYASLYDLQTSYKALVYSIKLKLEFSILNRLVELTQGGPSAQGSSYARTRVENNGVQMETFEGERQNKNRRAGDNMGNTVHVRSGAGAGAGAEDAKHTGTSVVMTTEITVHSNRIHSDFGGESEQESIGDKSAATADWAVEGTMGQSRAPSHSSERHIVETQY
ncbi:hypothetical protein MFIFM68171_00403 [Madurella fahalii]|uniref:DUF7703 domain-containing protein n=1 Tax=Madurella fahalii TaxID=1157608 RepID=A0ABQ0FXG7_9PEZI